MPEVLIEFDRTVQSIGALREAAYRLIGIASFKLETKGARLVCHLSPNESPVTRDLDEQGLRQRFMDLVTDENLREKVSIETTAIRNVIVALAFGALVEQENSGPGT